MLSQLSCHKSTSPFCVESACMHASISVLTVSRLAMQVSYAIGVAQPLSVHVDTYGTGSIPDKEILQAVLKNFDFRPGADPHPSALLRTRSRLSSRQCLTLAAWQQPPRRLAL